MGINRCTWLIMALHIDTVQKEFTKNIKKTQKDVMMGLLNILVLMHIRVWVSNQNFIHFTIKTV